MTHTIQNHKFGFELEFTGISRSEAVTTLESLFLHTAYGESAYGANIVNDSLSRPWKIVKDSSITPSIEDNSIRQNELVSPPLTLSDLPLITQVVNALQEAGAEINNTCGFHVHVDAEQFNFKSLKNLVKYYAKYEDMFYNALAVEASRASHQAAPLTTKHDYFLENLHTAKSLDDLEQNWYEQFGGKEDKYSETRYCGLNLHRLWYAWSSSTIEFRMFNSSLDMIEIETYITLALSISVKALNSKAVNSRKNDTVKNVYLFPKILGGLGIYSKNPETKEIYRLLVKNMKAAN